MHAARLVVIGSIVCSAVLVAACGTATIQMDNIERDLRTQFAAQLGADIKSIACPDGVEAKKGGTFDCTVTGDDGTKADFEVVQVDDKARVKANAPLLVHTGELAKTLEQKIGTQANSTVQVDCPDIVEGKKGAETTCKLEGDGEKHDVDVTFPQGIAGGNGSFSYKVK